MDEKAFDQCVDLVGGVCVDESLQCLAALLHPVVGDLAEGWYACGQRVQLEGKDKVIRRLAQVVVNEVDNRRNEIGWEIDDEVRDSRLRRRGEPEAIIADSRSDAALLRELLPPASIVRTDASWTPEQCGQALWEAVQPNLLP